MSCLLSLVVLASLPLAVPGHAIGPVNSRTRYTRAHTLGKDYIFDPRDGWNDVNITNSAYARPLPPPPRAHVGPRASSKGDNTDDDSLSGVLGGTVKHLVGAVWNGLKGEGTDQTVKITWYTGKDLLNPSCWDNTKWAPSDSSMACALTESGWEDHPQCFSFLELCNSPEKCVFVRVVDSCAGCAAGSKHVDLTKGAFSPLADLSEGVLNVKMRGASEPDDWYEDLWGPKATPKQ